MKMAVFSVVSECLVQPVQFRCSQFSAVLPVLATPYVLFTLPFCVNSFCFFSAKKVETVMWAGGFHFLSFFLSPSHLFDAWASIWQFVSFSFFLFSPSFIKWLHRSSTLFATIFAYRHHIIPHHASSSFSYPFFLSPSIESIMRGQQEERQRKKFAAICYFRVRLFMHGRKEKVKVKSEKNLDWNRERKRGKMCEAKCYTFKVSYDDTVFDKSR